MLGRQCDLGRTPTKSGSGFLGEAGVERRFCRTARSPTSIVRPDTCFCVCFPARAKPLLYLCVMIPASRTPVKEAAKQDTRMASVPSTQHYAVAPRVGRFCEPARLGCLLRRPGNALSNYFYAFGGVLVRCRRRPPPPPLAPRTAVTPCQSSARGTMTWQSAAGRPVQRGRACAPTSAYIR